MEPRADICGAMGWHERAWHKQKNIEVKILLKCITKAKV